MEFLLHFCCIVKPLFWWQLLKITVTIEFLLFVFPTRHSINHVVFSLVYLVLPNVFMKFYINHRDQKLWELKEFLKSIVPKHLTLWMRMRALERFWRLTWHEACLLSFPFPIMIQLHWLLESAKHLLSSLHSLYLKSWTHRSCYWPFN